MAEGNGIAARVAGVENANSRLWEEHREHRRQISILDRDQAVSSRRLTEIEKDIDNLGLRIDRMTRAFWAAAASLAGLAVAILAVVATLLSGGM